MLISRTISQITVGGNGTNNPVPFGMDRFDFNEFQLTLTYREVNVIVFHNKQGVNLEVTGLVHVDSQGHPMLGQNDVAYLPCPPFCEEDD